MAYTPVYLSPTQPLDLDLFESTQVIHLNLKIDTPELVTLPINLVATKIELHRNYGTVTLTTDDLGWLERMVERFQEI